MEREDRATELLTPDELAEQQRALFDATGVVGKSSRELAREEAERLAALNERKSSNELVDEDDPRIIGGGSSTE